MDDTKPEISASLTPSDIYYILFKHKWKILSLTAIGLLAAAAAYVLLPETIYRSEAKLFIRYVQEADAPMVEDAETRSTDPRGDAILSSEVEILSSLDLSRQVADAFGPGRVLEYYDGGDDLNWAAWEIKGGMAINAPRGSRVVTLSYAHPDREVVQPLLTAFIEEYGKKHVEVHMASGLFDDVLSKETQDLRESLSATEAELRRIRDEAGIISLDESKRAYAEQLSKVRQQIADTKEELAQRKAVIAEFGAAQVSRALPIAVVEEYRTVNGVLETLSGRVQEMVTTFGPESGVMNNLRQRIDENTRRKEEMEKQYPALKLPAVASATNDDLRLMRVFDPEEQEANVQLLATRLRVLEEHAAYIRQEASELNSLELSINDLQRRRDLQESQYTYLSSSLEKARINDALSTGRVSNITVLESPTPPIRDVGRLYKIVGGLGAGGLGLGLALAFALEMFIDQTVRRPGEVESRLGLPLFFSIPEIRGGLLGGPRVPALPAAAGKDRVRKSSWRIHHQLTSYFEALRDRLILHFELRGLRAKPKLVAVTSCGDHSGASTVAAGLAAALSKTGEGNVLLVDMKMEQRTPYHFRHGALNMGLNEFLESGNRNEAMVQDHLYVVPHATGNDRLSRILPRHFTDMIPKLRASDYDYIIFDMPAVSLVSVTPQLSRYMDMTFLTVESEKTNRDLLKRAAGLLAQANCTFSVVVNRARNYLPRALLQEV